MTAQELRLGNWVNTLEGIANIVGISYDKVTLDRIIEDGSFTVYDEYIECIEPIFLTEEILLKCGAAKKHHKVFTSNYELPLKRNKSLYITDVGTPNFMVGIVERDFETNQIEDCVNIHNWDFEKELHLHQLQNIFYSLTQTELEVNI